MKICWITYFLAFINVAFCQNDREHLLNQIDSIHSSALSYYKSNQIVPAFKAFNRVKKISDSINDSYGKATSNFYLGNIYNLMQQYDNAESNYKSMLTPSIDIKYNYLIANAYLALGKLYKKKNEGDVFYFEKALLSIDKDEIYEGTNYSAEDYHDLLLQIRIELCDFYIEKGNTERAIINVLRLEKAVDTVKNDVRYYKGYYNYIHGKYFVKKELYNSANEKFNEALSYLKTGLYKTNTNSLLLSKVYKEMSLSSAKNDDKEAAYQALLKYNEFNNEFLNKESINQDVIAKTKFLIEDYKNDALVANSEKIRQSEKTKTVSNINIALTISLILLAISLITLFKNYVSKRKLTYTLKNQNTELQFAKNEALKSSELKSKFISNVTHELRTPLYGVVGITSLLLNNNSLDNKDSRFLKSLKYSGDYLLNLVNEVLQFGKIESEDIELKIVSVDIRQLLENIAGSFDYKLQETNNKIKVSVDEQIPKYIECDNVRLSQVLINLIGNGIKFTKNGCINLRVKALNILNENIRLRFEIEDNGSGIPKEKFDIIFENFSQLENSNLNYQGTGLGLSISKKIIELFGSEIELESEYGKGSMFSFNVTFKLDKKQISCSTKVKILEDKVRNINSYKILIAEDNKINQIVTKNLLEKQNYDCKVVENGSEAIEALDNETFHLILMDINMPVMGGIEATKLIRKYNTNIPIIALTAADVVELKDNYKSIGFNGIITKPFDNYEFFQVIQTNIQDSMKFKGKLKKLY